MKTFKRARFDGFISDNMRQISSTNKRDAYTAYCLSFFFLFVFSSTHSISRAECIFLFVFVCIHQFDFNVYRFLSSSRFHRQIQWNYLRDCDLRCMFQLKKRASERARELKRGRMGEWRRKREWEECDWKVEMNVLVCENLAICRCLCVFFFNLEKVTHAFVIWHPFKIK